MNDGTRWVWLSVALLSLACGGEGMVVRLDLCPGPPQGTPEYEMLRRVTSWNVEVLGLEGDDVAWRRTFAGTDAIASLELSGAIPPGQQVRLIVEGFGLDNAGRNRVVAVAAGGPLVLRGNENVCLCIAPPEDYIEHCASWQCVYDQTSDTCQSPY